MSNEIKTIYLGPIADFYTTLDLLEYMSQHSRLQGQCSSVWPGPRGEAVGGFNCFFEQKGVCLKVTTLGVPEGHIAVQGFYIGERGNEQNLEEITLAILGKKDQHE